MPRSTSAYLLILGIFNRSSRIASFAFYDPFYPAEIFLHAPKTTSRKDSCLGTRDRFSQISGSNLGPYQQKEKKCNRQPALFLARVRNLRLEEEAALSDPEILALWNELIVFHERFHGRNDHLCALVDANLGLLFAGKLNSTFSVFGWLHRKLEWRNVKLAEENDRKSLTLHKENKEVYLALLGSYEKRGNG